MSENEPKLPPPIDMKSMIVGVSRAVADAQFEMDRNSMETAERLRDSGLAEQYGLQSRWYAIPEVDFNLKVMLQFSESGDLMTNMVSGDYSSRYQVDMKAASSFDMSIRRTPREMPSGPSLMTETGIVERVSRLRKVARILHENPGSYLTVAFESKDDGPAYAGGHWVVELVVPPGAQVGTRKVTSRTRNSLKDKFPFDLEADVEAALKSGAGGKELRIAFKARGIPFSSRARIEGDADLEIWDIEDSYYRQSYTVARVPDGPLRANLRPRVGRTGLEVLAFFMLEDRDGEFICAEYFA